MSLSAAIPILAAATFPKVAGWVLAGLAVFLFFSLSILIHEGGHFLAAKALGLRADAFALGFGPAIWKRKFGETEFRFCLVPFGGYVSLPQLDPAGMSKLQGEATPGTGGEASVFGAASWWKRVIVSVAGPFGNIVLAVPLAFLISVLPPVADPRLDFGGAVVGAVAPESDAAESGLLPGDCILEVSGRSVATWSDFVQEVHLLSGDGVASLVVSNRLDGSVRSFDAPVSRSPLGTWQIDGVAPAEPVGVGPVFPGGAAETAGLANGDAILSAGGIRCVSQSHLASILEGSDTVKLEVLRRGKIMQVEMSGSVAENATSSVPEGACVVISVIPGLAAESAGIEIGDVVLAVDGATPGSPASFIDSLRSGGGSTLVLDIAPNGGAGESRRVEVVPGWRDDPETGERVPFLGLVLGAAADPAARLAVNGFLPAHVDSSVPVWSRHRAPLAQLKGDAAAVWRVFSPLFGNRHKGELRRVGTSLGGPVLILSSMWMWVLANFTAALGFVRFLNVNLAIVNLLPIPVLDGGHVVFALWRGVTGREMPRKLVEFLVNAFALLLIGLFVLLSGCDAARLWRRFG